MESPLEKSVRLKTDADQGIDFVVRVEHELIQLGVAPRFIFGIRLALEEAVLNAIKHGNLEDRLDAEQQSPLEERQKREVDVSLHLKDVHPFQIPKKRVNKESEMVLVNSVLHVTIRDQGRGFNNEEIPDPTEEQNLDLSSGRGVKLMRYYMDHCHILPTPQGTTVIMSVAVFREKIDAQVAEALAV